VRYVVLHGGTEQGNPALDEATQARLVDAAERLGHRAERHGEDWLVIRD
jgi:hypothetical protein